jgi:lipopolysaccharide export system permease protein
MAFKRHILAISGAESQRATQGFWSRDDRHVVHVRRVLHGRIPFEIEMYQFDDHDRLQFVIWAQEAVIQNSRQWVLLDVVQKVVREDKIVTEHFARLPWDPPFRPEQVETIVLPVETLSPSALYGYVQYLKTTGQNAERPELIFWQQVSMPLSAIVMVLVAVPFVLGPMREASAGKRMLHGGLIGAAFYLGSQLVIHLGSTLQLHPTLITLSPVAVLCGFSVWLYRRSRMTL